jgi:hypothetical protein
MKSRNKMDKKLKKLIGGSKINKVKLNLHKCKCPRKSNEEPYQAGTDTQNKLHYK